MKPALLDTNFMLVPGKFKVDVFAELEQLGYKAVLLTCVVQEVKKLAKNKGKTGAQARIGLEIVSKEKPEIVEAKLPVDNALVDYAVANDAAIATNDLRLIKRAKEHEIMILRLRQKKYVGEE